MAALSLPLREANEMAYLKFPCLSCRENVEQLSCLPCLHLVSVCERKECKQSLMERGTFCQHCNERFDVPAEGFPPYSLAERKAAAKKIEEEGIFCCAKHDTSQVAAVFCSDCPGPLCEECHSEHSLSEFSREHNIVSLENTLKASLLPLEPLEPLEQCIKSAEKRTEEVLSEVRDVDGRLLTLHDKGNRCKEDIADLKEHMIEAVNRRCAVLVAEVEETEEKRSRDLEQHKKALEAQKNQLELFKTSAMEIATVQEGTTKEQLSLRQAVIQRASSLTSIPPPPAPPSSSSVFFVPEKKEEAEKILSVMGHVSFGPKPEASSMEGLSIVDNTVQCRPWGLPLSMRVVSRDCRGVECGRGGERVESDLTPTSCGVPVQGEVEDRGDGTYQVVFRSLPSEECRLSVTVNGSDIRGSPVRVKLNDPSIIKQEIRDHQGRCFHALVCTKEGILLSTDRANGEVCNFAQSGELLSSFEVLNPGSFLPGLAVLSDGNIAISMCSVDCVAVYRPNGESVIAFGLDKLKKPRGLAVNHRGQLLVADGGNHRVCVLTENGEFQYSFGSEGADPGQFNCSQQICLSQDGLMYISDFYNNRIQVFQQDGHFVQQFGQDVLNGPAGLALTKDGHIVVASFDASKLSVFTQSGECVHEVKEIGLNKPVGIAIADDGSIFVADRDNGRIVKL